MAKMFYTVEEAASRLGMTEAEVKGLGESGQLQEFRDRDRLMFKRDQVDLLAGDEGADELGADIRLAESGELEPLSLGSSGTGSAFNAAPGGSSPGDTGVSIFDPDESGADANADTLITGSPMAMDFGADASNSGSGLAQLTLESDDTSLGGDLLADLGGSGGRKAAASGAAMDSGMGGSAFGAAAGDSAAGSLFEGGGGETDFGSQAAHAALLPVGEPYDGAWSGIAGGAAVGMVLLLGLTLAVMIMGFSAGGATAVLDGVQSSTVLIVAGVGVVVVGLSAAIGWFMLRRS